MLARTWSFMWDGQAGLGHLLWEGGVARREGVEFFF